MKIEKNVKVGGKTYKIKFTENLDFGIDYLGEIDYKKNEIRLRNMSQNTQELTFLHELIHAICWFCGYKDHDEELVERFASALYMVIQDNPKLFCTQEVRP